MKVLYLGVETGTSRHRMNALRRLGHDVEVVDSAGFHPKVPLSGVWQRYFGSVGAVSVIRRRVMERLASLGQFDVVWVDSGALVSQELVQDLKSVGKRVLNYNVDDPYGPRDVNSWYQYSPCGAGLRSGSGSA